MVTSIHDDLLAPDVINDPYPYFARLRTTDPVHWNERHNAWVITRYDDFLWVTRHPEFFSSEVAKRSQQKTPAAADPATNSATNSADREVHEQVRKVQSDRFTQRDKDEHLGMRQVVHAFFTPTALKRWRPRIQAVVQELLDQASTSDQIDVLRHLAMPLDMRIISEMMGFPPEDQADLHALSDKMCALNRSEPDRIRVFMEGMTAFKAYLAPFVEDRLAQPGDDLLSLLVRGEQEGVYTRDQVLANASMLLIAGQETTANLVSNSLLAFLRHPEQWDRFQHALSDTPVSRAIDECLRYDAPQKSIERVAASTVELRDKQIREGDRVRCFISAANRDPEAFSEPDRLDITRYPNRHVAFGYGSHY